MTPREASERAAAIWGPRAVVSRLPHDDRWWIDVPGTASWHYLDDNGHVACRHDTCILAEQRLARSGPR